MTTKDTLLERLRQMPIIDAHEHLPPERVMISTPRDALTVYRQYTRLPMFASGLSQDDFRRMHDPHLPLLERWKIAQPYIERIKHTSFARVSKIILKAFWGVDELNEKNISSVSEQVAAAARPGLYEKVLRDKCGILQVLNQDTTQCDGLDLEVYRGQSILSAVVSLIDVKAPENVAVNRLGGPDGFQKLDDYLDWARARLRQMAAEGAVAFKTSSNAYTEVDREAALAEFAELQRTGTTLGDRLTTPLYSYIHEELLKAAAPLGLPVAVHTGFWGVNRHDPAHFIPVIERHPEIHFDLFHSGIPYMRVLGIMAVNYANLSVNLCWAHSINMAMTARSLDEYLDELGSDKIIAFGGDVHWMVEKVYGHLELARQNVAAVLARRVDQGLMDLDEAERLAKAWFVNNPARIYRLPITT